MGKIRRGNYIFVTWKGDHLPRHVHVYRDGKQVLKWDLANWQPIIGQPDARLLALLAELVASGDL